jgi:hypothetical protein
MRQGGRLARTIRSHLAAHPDEALSTDDLCAVCYPGRPIERKHRVAVLRAAESVLTVLPDWRSRRGRRLWVYNAASVPSTAKVRATEAERAVAEHIIMRDGTPEERQRLIAQREAEHMLETAKLQYAAALVRSLGVLVGASREAPDNLSELAEKARALMRENNLDAIRDGLAEIAAALDGIARREANGVLP